MKTVTKILISTLLILPGLASSQKNCYNDALNAGIAAYNKGDYAKARTIWTEAKNCPSAKVSTLNQWISKATDGDGDGVRDYYDKCPSKYAKTSTGCPPTPLKDQDEDGTPDRDDRCINDYGPKRFKGCPDADGDGIPDIDDKCDHEYGTIAYKGCPPPKDSDGDGVPDEKDKCKSTYANTPDGCPLPLDSDGDGVADSLDKCPNQKGPSSNNGCPILPPKCEECPEMVSIPSGSFTMGDTFGEGDADEKKTHTVTIQAFELGRYEVTQRQWKAVMGSDSSYFKGCDDCPVERVSWDDVQEFIKKLNEKTGKNYRLPTEAEWEYAAREGGKKVRFGNGKDIADPAEINFDGSEKYKQPYSVVGEYRVKTTPVGSLKCPNALGLHDMSGNVWEWCQDTWHDSYDGAPTDGSAWTSGGDQSRRVVRGGSWVSNPYYCRAAYRVRSDADDRVGNVGFRLAR